VAKTIWNQYTEVQAAKPHWCAWCKKTRIEKGEVHLRYVGEFEGDFQDWRIHKECREPVRRSCDGGDGIICDSIHEKGKYCDECRTCSPLSEARHG